MGSRVHLTGIGLRFAALVTVVAAIVSTVAPHGKAAENRDASIAFERAERLRRGINLSHWFAQVFDKTGYTPQHFRSHTTGDDFDLIARIGFDHVRLSVEPAPMFDAENPAAIPAAYLAELDAAIVALLDRKLAVVVDIHPSSEFKAKLGDDAFVERFARFWSALARHLSRYDPNALFLEILNEPEMRDPYRWIGVQTKLARAIREAAPKHTIVATGNEWSSYERLLFLEPLDDENVIYTFHYYEPHLFTHQGATWGSPEWPYVKNVPYPAEPSRVAGLLDAVENEAARRALAAYGEERWSARRVEEQIARAGEWGARHRVPVICNEFGVYRAFSPRESRLAWLVDARRALEARGIGWTMWDYAGSFGIVTKRDGKTTVDTEVAAALGLGRVASE